MDKDKLSLEAVTTKEEVFKRTKDAVVYCLNDSSLLKLSLAYSRVNQKPIKYKASHGAYSIWKKFRKTSALEKKIDSIYVFNAFKLYFILIHIAQLIYNSNCYRSKTLLVHFIPMTTFIAGNSVKYWKDVKSCPNAGKCRSEKLFGNQHVQSVNPFCSRVFHDFTSFQYFTEFPPLLQEIL